MSMSKVTMIGMYNFDNTLFDGLIFPEGINKDIAVNEVLIRCGEFEVNYPEISFMKNMISHWGQKHFRTFQKWIDALNIEFDPLYNYDRFEEYEDTRTHKNNTKSTRSESESNSSDMQSSNKTNTVTNDNNTLKRDVSAFDASTYQAKDKETTEDSQNVNGTSQSTSTATGKNSLNASEGIDEAGDETSKHKAHLYGNIGVTTSTQMLEDYIRVERFNIYEQIADIFVDEFCICVYE